MALAPHERQRIVEAVDALFRYNKVPSDHLCMRGGVFGGICLLTSSADVQDRSCGTTHLPIY